MNLSLKKIIEKIEKDYPKVNAGFICNIAESEIEEKTGMFNQYIIGVTPRDEHHNSFRDYKTDIENRLNIAKGEIHSIGWAFGEDEVDGAKTVLKELSDYFNVELDIDSTMKKALRTKIHRYYVVVTVVRVPMFFYR